MRGIFTSQRVETVEGVAALLNEADIQVKISHQRSYHSKRNGQFSYLDTKTKTNIQPSGSSMQMTNPSHAIF
ncbi:pathogenicity-related protein [Xylella fastidiosa subsp. fastidiosa GB514]|nr:pathogenicity-related protein [Xylella fastidiosa subsp. fastidiosa GB514]